jgi:hypothetical protein
MIGSASRSQNEASMVVAANLHNAVAVGVVGMRTSTYALPTSMMGQRYAQESVGGLQTWSRGG